MKNLPFVPHWAGSKVQALAMTLDFTSGPDLSELQHFRFLPQRQERVLFVLFLRKFSLYKAQIRVWYT